MNFSNAVAQAWEEALLDTPDPFSQDILYDLIGKGPRTTYRQRLDRQPVNMRGDLIPRIRTVKRNLLLQGSMRLDPTRLTTPHRNLPHRRPKGKGRRKTDM